MAFEQPIAQQETTGISASEDRKAFAVFAQPSVATPGSLAVTQRAAGANMSVDVAAGTAVVPQGQGTETIKRVYPAVTNTATVNLAINAAPAVGGQSRNDLVVCQIRDNAVDAGGVNDWYLRVITGTAATTGAQVDPAIPDNAYALARVTLAFGDSSVTNAKITDLRTSNTSRALSGHSLATGASAEKNALKHSTSGQRLVVDTAGLLSSTPGALQASSGLAVPVLPPYTINNLYGAAADAYYRYPNAPLVVQDAMQISSTAASSTIAWGIPLLVTRTARLAEIKLLTSTSAFSGSVTVAAALYSDSNGRPGTKIADLGSVVVTTASSSVKTITVSSPQLLDGGTRYWLSFHRYGTVSSGVLQFEACMVPGSDAYSLVSETPTIDSASFSGYQAVGPLNSGHSYRVSGGSWTAITTAAPTTWINSPSSLVTGVNGGAYGPSTVLRLNYV